MFVLCLQTILRANHLGLGMFLTLQSFEGLKVASTKNHSQVADDSQLHRYPALVELHWQALLDPLALQQHFEPSFDVMLQWSIDKYRQKHAANAC